MSPNKTTGVKVYVVRIMLLHVFQGHIRPVCSVCVPGVRHQQSVCGGKVQDPSHCRNVFCEVGDV